MTPPFRPRQAELELCWRVWSDRRSRPSWYTVRMAGIYILYRATGGGVSGDVPHEPLAAC